MGVFGRAPHSSRSKKQLCSKIFHPTQPALVAPPWICSEKKSGANPNSMVFMEYLTGAPPNPNFVELR
jgi:hypothetical protein